MSDGNLQLQPNMMPTNRPKKRRRLVKIFLTTLTSVIALFVLLSAVIVVAYNRLNGTNVGVQAVAKAIDSNLKSGGGIGDLFSGVKKRTNFLVLGLDSEGGGSSRTDFMMVGCFNSETGEINLISLPRDTHAVMPESRRQVLKEQGMWTPSTGVMKLNEVHHYAGDKFGVEFIVKQAEELLGIQIEYYVKIDLDAFKYLIDEIGGVEFDVPQRMIYDDPEQKLHIDLQPGLQILNGSQAEGLVRYRKSNSTGAKSPGYAMGDLRRVEVQQDFMKAVIAQALSSKKLLSNADALLSTAFKYVKTNMPITDALKYVQFADKVKSENIYTYTLPGTPMDGSPYYFIPDGIRIAELADEIFYSTGKVEEESAIGKNIKVLNGAGVAGLASKTKEALEENGFTVSAIGDYTGTRTPHTRIMIKRKGLGADLQKLFSGSVIELDRTMENGSEIIIILGTDEE